MSLINRAKTFAALAHAGQKRKYTEEAYINHPLEVAEIVSRVTTDEAVIAAAILHDVVEDTHIQLDEIERIFGSRVAELVENLTDVSQKSDGNRAARKAIDLSHTAKSSADAKTIKLADLICNARSIVQHDLKFAKVYLKEKEALLGVLGNGDATLYAQAVEVLEQSKSVLEQAGGSA